MFALSIKGSPRRWFDAALARGDAASAWAAAHELGRLKLADALALCLLLRDQQPSRYERAAARWAARLTLEAHAVRLPDLGLAVAALHALSGVERDAGVGALASLRNQHGPCRRSAPARTRLILRSLHASGTESERVRRAHADGDGYPRVARPASKGVASCSTRKSFAGSRSAGHAA